MSRINRRVLVAGLAAMGAGGLMAWYRRKAETARITAYFDKPLPVPKGPMRVFHLGHSLVGRDMPAMLSQLAGHEYDSQLGWGTSLKEHWEPDLAINGFESENNHPRYRDARVAIETGEYDAVVLTEMVEIADAVRYHASADYLARWTGLALRANPRTRVYLYETWHHTDDPKGWLWRIDRDLRKYWQGRLIRPATGAAEAVIHLIPAGQVMAALARRISEQGDVGGLTSVNDLFAKQADGTPDAIHFNDIGAYLVAITHYAVLYHASPEGLPHQLRRAVGTSADAPTAEAAGVMQRLVWQVARAHRETGVAA